MGLGHKLLLYAALIFLGLSLIVPGLIEIFKTQPGIPGLSADTIAAKNQLRAYNAVMAAFGFMALWACVDLQQQRSLVLILGSILLLVCAARFFSLIVDGVPDTLNCLYLLIELALAGLFLLWPPNAPVV